MISGMRLLSLQRAILMRSEIAMMSEHLVLRWRGPVRRTVVQITITEHFEPMNYDQERN